MNNQSPEYFITYAVMDSSAGANPFGHAFLMLSERGKDGKTCVTNTLGFYSQLPGENNLSSTNNPLVAGIKSLLGVKFDLQEVHGQFHHEKMREINHRGISGISFELSEEQFNQITKEFDSSIADNKKAIEEYNSKLDADRRNAYERWQLDQKEQDKKLLPFHIEVQLGLSGPDSTPSSTCKDVALDFLVKHAIITDDIKQQFKNTWKGLSAFPLSSGVELHPIRLQHIGDLHKEVSKRSKKEFYNPQFSFEKQEDDEVAPNQLCWVVPPVIFNSENIQKLPQEQMQPMEAVLDRFRKLEQQLYKNADLDANLKLSLLQEVVNIVDKATSMDLTQLDKSIAETNKLLNVLEVMIEPSRLDASFLLRAYYDTNFRQAVLGFLVSAASITLLYYSPPIMLVFQILEYCCYALIAYSTYKSMNHALSFLKNEEHFAEMKSDFQSYQISQQPAF